MNNVYFCRNICIKIHNYILGHKDSTNLKRVVSYADKQHQHPSPKFLRQQSCQWTSRQTECRQNFYFMSNVDGDDSYTRRDTHSFSKLTVWLALMLKWHENQPLCSAPLSDV